MESLEIGFFGARGVLLVGAASVAAVAATPAMAEQDVPVTVHDIEDVDALVRDELPSTPTLLAVEGKQLVYAGPVTSGSLCATVVQRVLGVAALEAPRARPILNWLDTGCYCRRQP